MTKPEIPDLSRPTGTEAGSGQAAGFLRTILESLTFPFYVINVADHSVALANETALAVGSEKTTCYALTHNRQTPCDSAEHPCPLEVVRRTGEPFSCEHIHFDAQGQPRTVEVHGYPVKDGAGRVVQMIEFTLDITEARQAELALRESEDRLQTMMRAIMTGIVLIDAETHRIVEANPAAVRMIGAPHQEIIGAVCHQFICPARVRECPITDLGQEVDNSERVLLTAVGERVPIMKTVVSVQLDGRRHLLESFVDVTKLHSARQALQDRENALRSITDTVQDAIVMVDEQGLLLFWNPAAERMFGLRAQEAVGSSLATFLADDEEIAIFMSILRRLMVAGKGGEGTTMEMTGLRSDGVRFPMELSLAAMPLQGQNNVVAVVRDITERKESEQELDRYQAQLEDLVEERTLDLLEANRKLRAEVEERRQAEAAIKKSLEEKDVLLSEVHHRVKNNMQVISSLLRLQSRAIKDEQFAEMVRESQNRIRAMALIHEKLYRSRDLANIRFEDYIRDLVADLFRFYAVRRQRIGLRLETDDVRLEVGRAISCGLIVNELVTNALKHAFPDGASGEIRIAFRQRQDGYELVVADNGCGLPPGQSLDGDQSLGLRLVSILAEDQLKGRLTVVPGPGAEFRIRFGPGQESRASARSGPGRQGQEE